MSQNNKTKQRSLEQMLELTKRYYVTQKAKQLQKKLEELSANQKRLSEKENIQNTPKAQAKLTNSFKALSESLSELRRKNNNLSKLLNFLSSFYLLLDSVLLLLRLRLQPYYRMKLSLSRHRERLLV